MMFTRQIQKQPTSSLGTDGIRDLWVAFLRRMISDATSHLTAPYGNRALIIASARDWLTEPRFRRDREWVAMAIGVESTAIDRFVRELESNGWNCGAAQFSPCGSDGDPCL